MTKKIYPHWLRAIRVREDMVLITIKNVPSGAWEDILSCCGDEGFLLGVPPSGWFRLAVPTSLSEKIILSADTEIIPNVCVIDVYGTEMRELCVPTLQTMEKMGQKILGVSLSTQRLSAAVQGEYPDLSVLYNCFPMEL